MCCKSKLRTLMMPLTIVISSRTCAFLTRVASSSTIDWTSYLILFSKSLCDSYAPSFMSCWISCSIWSSLPKLTSDAIRFDPWNFSLILYSWLYTLTLSLVCIWPIFLIWLCNQSFFNLSVLLSCSHFLQSSTFIFIFWNSAWTSFLSDLSCSISSWSYSMTDYLLFFSISNCSVVYLNLSMMASPILIVFLFKFGNCSIISFAYSSVHIGWFLSFLVTFLCDLVLMFEEWVLPPSEQLVFTYWRKP